MDLRRTLLAHAWAQAGLWIVIAVLLNHIASAWFARVDLTEDQRYTLSPTAQGVMKKLDKPLLARVFFTGDLEAPYNNYQQATVEKLEELRAWSGGRMEIEVLDPTGNKDLEEEAQRFGVLPIQYTLRSSGRAEVKQVYMGVSFVYGDRQEAVSSITVIDTLEYDLTRAIHALTVSSDERKTVAYLQGNGEPDLATFDSKNPIGTLRDRLMQTYTLQPLSLGGEEGVPDEVDVLLVIGPQQSVPDRTQYQLDQFVMRGGSVAFFIGSYRADWRTMRSAEVRHDLNALLGSYGVQLNKDAIVDRTTNERMRVPVTTPRGQQLVTVNYPLIPVTAKVNKTHVVSQKLDRVVAPFASSVELADVLPDAVEGQVLIESNVTSTRMFGLRHLRPEVFKTPAPGEEKGPWPFAIALQGRFSSFFADRAIPPLPGEETAPDDPTSKLLDGEPAQVIVVSSADFVANNLPFVLNAVDWMVQDESLITIRSRSADFPVLEAPAPERINTVRAGIVLPPLLVLFLLGGAVWFGSRRSS